MTIALQSLAGLSLDEKRRLLARLLQEKSERSAAVFPLSHGQRGLWFLHQMDPHSSAYNVCYPSRIRSPLDLSAFRRAVQKLVDRHPGLRTTFEERDGVLLQRVHEDPPLPFEVVDASDWSEEELRRRLEAEAHRPFDLERGPLVRMHLFRRAADDHIFLLTVHHIVGDFWSLVLVMEEMQALYPAAARRPARGAADPGQGIPRLRPLAGRPAGRPRGRAALGILGAAARRRVDGARPADRPAAPACLLPARWRHPLAARAGPGPPAQGAGGERGDHALHRAAVRVPGAARPVHRPGGFPGRLPVRRPEPTRIRGRDRLLHQHAAPPRRPVGRSDLPRRCSAASGPPCSTPSSTRTIPSPCWWSG